MTTKKNCLDIFALLFLFAQQISGLYKIEAPNEDGSNLLVQNAKPNFAYIFLSPRSARSPGLAVHSLALEVRLRLAEFTRTNLVPFYLFSNHLLVGSATDGRTPFMQLNGKYIEGTDLIIDALEEEAKKLQEKTKYTFTFIINAMKAASTSSKEDDVAAKKPKKIEKIRKKELKAEAERKEKEVKFMQNAQTLFLILLRDRVHPNVNPTAAKGESKGGLQSMFSDQSVIEELVPLLFAVKPLADVPILFGKKNTDADDIKGKARAEDGKHKKVGKLHAGPYGEKCLKDLAFWKAYFDARNGPGKNAKIRFLELHANCLGDLMNSQPAAVSKSKKPPVVGPSNWAEKVVPETVRDEQTMMAFWELFDERMRGLIAVELLEYFTNEQTGQEQRMKTFVSGKSVEIVTKFLGLRTSKVEGKLLLECTDKEAFNLFKEARESIADQLRERYNAEYDAQYTVFGGLRASQQLRQTQPQFLFGPEPTKTDAFLFAVLLQYNMEGDGLNMEKLRKEFILDKKIAYDYNADRSELRNYVKEMRQYLGFGWTQREDIGQSMVLRPWPTMYEHVDIYREDKYKGPFGLETDSLYRLPDFSWDREEAFANFDNPNRELLKYVYNRIDSAYLKWNQELFEKKGKTMKHFVASFLCELEGNEKPGQKVGVKAEDCKWWHLEKIKEPLVEEMQIEIKKVVYNSVAEFLIEQKVVKTLERANGRHQEKVQGDPLLGDEH